MAGIVDNEEKDLRVILVLYQVEERKAMRQRQKQLVEIVASMGGTPDHFDENEVADPERSSPSSIPHRGYRGLPMSFRAMALHRDWLWISLCRTRTASHGISPGHA